MHYIHQAPGRIRVRSAAIKKRPESARALTTMLLRERGVASVNVNAVTGSILIRYSEGATSAEALLERLREWGFLPRTVPAGAEPRPFRPAPAAATRSLTGIVLQTAMEKALETAVERSVVRLIAALL